MYCSHVSRRCYTCNALTYYYAAFFTRVQVVDVNRLFSYRVFARSVQMLLIDYDAFPTHLANNTENQIKTSLRLFVSESEGMVAERECARQRD